MYVGAWCACVSVWVHGVRVYRCGCMVCVCIGVGAWRACVSVWVRGVRVCGCMCLCVVCVCIGVGA